MNRQLFWLISVIFRAFLLVAFKKFCRPNNSIRIGLAKSTVRCGSMYINVSYFLYTDTDLSSPWISRCPRCLRVWMFPDQQPGAAVHQLCQWKAPAALCGPLSPISAGSVNNFQTSMQRSQQGRTIICFISLLCWCPGLWPAVVLLLPVFLKSLLMETRATCLSSS